MHMKWCPYQGLERREDVRKMAGLYLQQLRWWLQAHLKIKYVISRLGNKVGGVPRSIKLEVFGTLHPTRTCEGPQSGGEVFIYQERLSGKGRLKVEKRTEGTSFSVKSKGLLGKGGRSCGGVPNWL